MLRCCRIAYFVHRNWLPLVLPSEYPSLLIPPFLLLPAPTFPPISRINPTNISTRESSPRRRKHRATATTATTATLKPSSTPPAPRLRRRQRRPLQQPSPQQEHRYSLAPNHRASDDDDAEQHQRQRIRRLIPPLDADTDTDGTTDQPAEAGGGGGGGGIGIGQGTARGILDFVLGGGSVGVSGSRGGGLRQSMTAMSAAGTADAWIGGGSGADGDGGSAMMSGGDEEGLGLLRQQLSAVQRIRIEHERKDAAIAALRLEVHNKRTQGLRRTGKVMDDGVFAEVCLARDVSWGARRGGGIGSTCTAARRLNTRAYMRAVCVCM